MWASVRMHWLSVLLFRDGAKFLRMTVVKNSILGEGVRIMEGVVFLGSTQWKGSWLGGIVRLRFRYRIRRFTFRFFQSGSLVTPGTLLRSIGK